MLARVKTCAISGIDAAPVEVEVFARGGDARFTIIGLGDSAVRESRDRVISAIRQSGFQLPDQILVNLAPAEMKKEGSSFDLPIALGILAASGQVNQSRVSCMSFHGELALDGKIKPVRGALSLALQSVESGSSEVVVPAGNSEEASLLPGGRVTGVSSLSELVLYLNHQKAPRAVPRSGTGAPARRNRLISEVWGQQSAKRALMIAAAGSHNALMIGPPGCGKSMLAERFCSLLPPLSREEMLESVRIHGIAGAPVLDLLRGERPWRAPHHLVSDAGLIGGGTSPRPGEISLAHNGVLFLDEFPEFRRSALESLRAPLESGSVRIARARSSLVFPARFQLVAAMNPCPCGRLGSPSVKNERPCMCSRPAIESYLRKLSGPILDRIDLHVELEAVPFQVLMGQGEVDCAGEEDRLRSRVLMARERQLRRAGRLNSMLSAAELGSSFEVKAEAGSLLERAAQRIGISARGFVRIMRVAATISDLDEAGAIGPQQVAEALGFRGLERIHSYIKGR